MLKVSTITKAYQSILDYRTTEEALDFLKTFFCKELCAQLGLMRVAAPMIVLKGTGVNDDLNGIERPVGFPIKDLGDQKAEVVHSLAKWKRWRLAQLGIEEGKGIVTDMRALRPDEELSPIHSIQVDQWDWEKHISKTDRTVDYLKKTIRSIYQTIRSTEQILAERYPALERHLPETIHFISAEELLQLYPDLSPKEREDKIVAKYGAVFLMGIGAALSDGKKHDGRAPDYDDWSSKTGEGFKGLNGDILVWHPVLKRAFELSSMGIRVDKIALLQQLKISQEEERSQLAFHQKVIEGSIPLSIGGGIGQSRVAMFLLRKAHIGEVQASIWTDEIYASCKEQGIQLL